MRHAAQRIEGVLERPAVGELAPKLAAEHVGRVAERASVDHRLHAGADGVADDLLDVSQRRLASDTLTFGVVVAGDFVADAVDHLHFADDLPREVALEADVDRRV
ncbi:MAG: hypothetical protein AAF928_16150, partial [Myxococcota bacterium]